MYLTAFFYKHSNKKHKLYHKFFYYIHHQRLSFAFYLIDIILRPKVYIHTFGHIYALYFIADRQPFKCSKAVHWVVVIWSTLCLDPLRISCNYSPDETIRCSRLSRLAAHANNLTPIRAYVNEIQFHTRYTCRPDWQFHSLIPIDGWDYLEHKYMSVVSSLHIVFTRVHTLLYIKYVFKYNAHP